MKTREGGNKACDPVRSQPDVTDVELRRMGETMKVMICGVLFPLAAFRTRWIVGLMDGSSLLW